MWEWVEKGTEVWLDVYGHLSVIPRSATAQSHNNGSRRQSNAYGLVCNRSKCTK